MWEAWYWLTISAHDSGSNGQVWVLALAGSLCCVLGQDALLSQCLSPTGVYMGTGENLMLGVTL